MLGTFMKRLSKHIRFFIIFFFFTALVAAIRLYWISKAQPSKAVVLYIKRAKTHRGSSQYYPIVEYPTNDYIIRCAGSSNLPVEAGQTLNILYNPQDLYDWRINETYWLWFDIWSWYQFALLAIILYYVLRFVLLKTDKNLARRHAANRKML